MLRTHRSVTWISAGVAEAGHLEGHCLVRVVAEALEASMGVSRGQSFAGLVGHLSELFFKKITIMIHAFAFILGDLCSWSGKTL